MSERFSLSNVFSSISWDQFQTLVKDFSSHCATSFGCECNLEIRAMNALKVFTTHWPDDHVIRYMDEVNEKNTFFKTDDLSSFTRAVFDTAVFVEVFVRPVDETKAPQSAFGAIDFKGKLRRHATFYIQPGDNEVLNKLKASNRFMLVGDGYAYHCDPG